MGKCEISKIPSTAIVSHGIVDPSARETYGKGPLLLRIGNGGAGATGLLRALANDYLLTTSQPASIEWVCNHSRNTQLALLNGYIDIALTYERDQEELAASEGWSRTLGCVFHDHFCLAGPSSDPAHILSASSLVEALTGIAQTRALFHSRKDTSATMWKEYALWESTDIRPWIDSDALSNWYKTSISTPAEALIAADQAGAYLLTDRSTFLSLVQSRQIHNTMVILEPDGPDHPLMNSCYALIREPQCDERREGRKAFADYLFSDRGQDVVATFGLSRNNDFPFFAKAADGCARTLLRGRICRNGFWERQAVL